MTTTPMVTTQKNTSSTFGTAAELRLRVILLRLLGGILVFYSIAWFTLIYIYLVMFVHNVLPTLSDTGQTYVAQFIHLPQVHYIQSVVYISPLPLLVLGIGCLYAVEWARRGSIAFLALELLALLLIVHFLTNGSIHVNSNQFLLTPRHGYFIAATLVFIHGFLIEFFLRSHAATRKN
jgi:hypothetical protein